MAEIAGDLGNFPFEPRYEGEIALPQEEPQVEEDSTPGSGVTPPKEIPRTPRNAWLD